MRTHLLIVEDDPDLGELTKTSLEIRGFSVAWARNASEAVAALQQQRPDVAIIDYFLENGVTGLEVLKQLQQNSAMKTVPVFFMSGLLDLQVEKEIRNAGTKGLLTKPLHFETLLKRVGEALNPSGQSQETH